jgi:hypothetical protein
VPFATSLALNSLAKRVQGAESDDVAHTFDSPTPFTEKAYRIEVATKSKPIAIVAAKDIQAAYLAPYVVGGSRYLGTKRAMLAPRGVGLNRYGNLPRAKLASLKGKPGVFIGPVTTKSGKVINGVWQRTGAKGGRRGRGQRGQAKPPGALKLLIQFEDTTPVRKRLDFYGRARKIVTRYAAADFDAAMRRALATKR